MKIKHLNSDLLCCNFTDMSDKDFYDALKWANKKLMKNHYDRQKEGQYSSKTNFDHLYDNLDASFRGFRQSAGRSDFNQSKLKKHIVKQIGKNTKRETQMLLDLIQQLTMM